MIWLPLYQMIPETATLQFVRDPEYFQSRDFGAGDVIDIDVTVTNQSGEESQAVAGVAIVDGPG
jgi:hypothetical protein